MKKAPLILVLALAACITSGCAFLTYAPNLGMSEKKWLSKTYSNDLVYIEGTVKAYRASGSYYYFRDGKLVKVDPSLLPADRV